MKRLFFILLFTPSLTVVGSSFQSFSNQLMLFTSDGCSSFPDSFGSYNWQHCYINHDYAYWKGGVKADRVAADEQLNQCVSKATFGLFGYLIEVGVSLGGGADLPASWHWGYGWALNRGYKALGLYEQT